MAEHITTEHITTEHHLTGYPQAVTRTGHVEPVPRRIRAMLGGQVVVDTTRALYV